VLYYTIFLEKGKILIQGKNIALWALEKYDLLKNLQWANDRELISLTGMPVFPKSMIELEAWYVQAVKNPTNKCFTIKTNDGLYIGNIELNSIDWISRSLEIGILIGDRACRNKGFGTEATIIMLDLIFKQMDFQRVYLNVGTHNTGAIKLYEKCGFSIEGKKRNSFFFDNHYVDVLEMSLLKDEFFLIKNSKFKKYF